MSDASELKPCPFCGNDGTGPIEDALQVCHFEHYFHEDSWTVQCDKCSATMGYSDSEDEAIAAWNRRAGLVPAPSVTVKPLEWIKEDGESVWTAGAYTIRDDGDGFDVDFFGNNLAFFGHDSLPLPLDGAERTAQAHHEDYVLAAIQIGPQLADLVPAPGWQPIETCEEEDRAVLIYSATDAQDEDWPGHAMTVSNPAYVTSGNAALHGYTHWMPLPAPPSEGVEP